MREIKFMGKRIEDSEWTYGHYVKGVHSYIISSDDFKNAVVSIGGRMCTDSDVVYE